MTSRLEELAVQRHRHPIVLRHLTVQKVQQLSPNYVRIRFQSDDLSSFVSASFDDHIKVFFAENFGEQIEPMMGEEGVGFAEGSPSAAARDYTPRSFDIEQGWLEVDFVTHDNGPAGLWATHAKEGDLLHIAGPRGSMVIPMEYDWHLLVGDETALPAIVRRLEELPGAVIPLVVVELEDVELARIIPKHPQLRLQVLQRTPGVMDPSAQLVESIKQLELPKGLGYAWAAAEFRVSQNIRAVLEQEHGLGAKQIKAASYWRA